MSRRTELASAVATIKAKGKGGIPKIGQVELTDKTLYLNVAVKGQAGIVNLVDVNTRREVGITNIDGNKLNAGRDYVIDGIRVLWGQDANLKAQNWGTLKNLMPAEFLAAEFRIKQAGTVLVDMPITDLTIDPFVAFRSLSTSPLIRSNLEFEIEIEYPKNVSVPTDKEYNVRFEFRSHQAKR